MSGVRLPDFDVSPEEVEWQFWNIVKTPDRPVEVLYGSDLDTLQFGSGFPRVLGEDAAAFLTPPGVTLGGAMDTETTEPEEPPSASIAPPPDAGEASEAPKGLFARAKARMNPYAGA